MKSLERILIYGAILIMAYFLFKSCNSNPGDTVEVKTPTITGTLQTDKPIVHTPIIRPNLIAPKTLGSGNKNGQNMPLSGHADLDTAINYLNLKIIAESERMIQEYKKANDSLKLALFEQSVQPNEVNQTLENDTIKIDANIKLLGTVENIRIDYTIKPFKVKANFKQYLLLAGSEIGSNQLLSQFRIKGNLMYLSPRKTLYSASIDNQGIIYAGIAVKLFQYNR